MISYLLSSLLTELELELKDFWLIYLQRVMYSIILPVRSTSPLASLEQLRTWCVSRTYVFLLRFLAGTNEKKKESVSNLPPALTIESQPTSKDLALDRALDGLGVQAYS